MPYLRYRDQSVLSLLYQAIHLPVVCTDCELVYLPFRCQTCYQLTPWIEGAADEYPHDCDSCAAEKIASETS